MHIAWVLYGALDQRTGGTIYDAEVVAGLRRAGDEVTVVSLDPVEGGRDVATQLEAIGADVVVGDELCFRELGVAFPKLAGARARMRRVLLVHHLTAWETELAPQRRAAIRGEEQRALDACDAIVVTSRTTRARLVAEGVTVAVEVVLPGADRLRSTRERERERERGTRFVFVGAVVARKCVMELVRAFGKGDDGARLVIVGSIERDQGYVDEVRGEIARLGIGERVLMTGEVDEEGVARALDDADALVMPSSLEGYGIAATEAIFGGLPVIATRAEGLEEALSRCPDATLFVEDEASLASALSRFAGDGSLRASMTKAAREAAARMPTWVGCAEEFRSALVALVGSG